MSNARFDKIDKIVEMNYVIALVYKKNINRSKHGNQMFWRRGKIFDLLTKLSASLLRVHANMHVSLILAAKIIRKRAV